MQWRDLLGVKLPWVREDEAVQGPGEINGARPIPRTHFKPGPQGGRGAGSRPRAPWVSWHLEQVSHLMGVHSSWDQGSPRAEEPNGGKGESRLAAGLSHGE